MLHISKRWLALAATCILAGMIAVSCANYRPFEDLCQRECDSAHESFDDREECYNQCRQ